MLSNFSLKFLPVQFSIKGMVSSFFIPFIIIPKDRKSYHIREANLTSEVIKFFQHFATRPQALPVFA